MATKIATKEKKENGFSFTAVAAGAHGKTHGKDGQVRHNLAMLRRQTSPNQESEAWAAFVKNIMRTESGSPGALARLEASLM